MSPELPRALPPPAPRALAALRRRLLAWYRTRRRDLPWRTVRDPYGIWVSEVMLQQTRVAAVRPFYQRFMARFPTVRTLARAAEPEVLAAWAGLGYYRRARLLHEAARRVVGEHGGVVPDEKEVFARLPGVGRYTTGAVLSIAFDRPLPALDGNVARVLARLFALRAAVREPRGARRLWALAEALLPARGAGEWNQALMELGATVCLPRGPRCDSCPARADCRALALGKVAHFPPAVARRPILRLRRAVVLIARCGRALMVQREGRLLAGLWEPPGVELRPGRDARAALCSALARLGLRVRLAATGEVIRHTITHRRIEVEVWRGTLRGGLPRGAHPRWVDPGSPEVAVTALARKLARAVAAVPGGGSAS